MIHYVRAVLSVLIGALVLTGCALHPGAVERVRLASDLSRPVVATPAGDLRGIDGDGVRAFLGVPYAAPPVGDLRWRAPRPAEHWKGVRDASKIGSDCTQALGRRAVLGGGGGVVFGSEDCLTLNIYAPAGEPAKPRPVMVYLHGGAFTIGAGANYDPSLLAVEQDRVLVTLNFRLGALGWLAHPGFAAEGDGPNSGAGGNWGLMDQQAALRWVHDNIAAFGGDPGDVTLFGESSGAWSACYLMSAPSSEGLWSRVILQSGPCLEPSSLNDVATAAQAGPAFAELLGCDGPDAVACLRALPNSAIARTRSVRSGLNGPGSWGPVYGDALVPVSPARAFASGDFIRTPVIVGTNADEGRLFAVEVRNMERYDDETRWMYGEEGTRVLAHYPVGDDGPGLTMARSFTDQRFACPSDALRRVLARYVPTYGYEFVDPAPPIVAPRFLLPYDMGAYHASEVTYVFGRAWAFASPGKFTPEQAALARRMRDAWAGFGHDPAFEANWPRVGERGTPLKAFDPGGDRADEDFFVRHQCAMWDGSDFGAVIQRAP
jgi:para-nitrobenzyl esterase